MPTSPLSDRPVVLITGSAKRLGRDIALDLGRHGFDVAVHYRHSAQEADATATELRQLGARAHTFAADLADEAACRALVPAVISALGRIDAVVNSASTFEFDDASSFSYATLERHLRANTAPAIVLAQALAEHLIGTPRQGVVVNLLDQKLWNPNPDFLSYTLSKAALESATVLLAMALAPQVRVAGVAPGLTLDSAWLQGDKFAALHRQSSLLGRASSPEDVARSVRFVLETRSITGTTILVDAGQHLRRFERDFSMM
jgi:NAD(P)-dependent dehydrogenase (short-subunit alcohol dehydrogenase family)